MVADEAFENPYPGLRPFQADETHLFFGRDEQTAELLRRLQRSRFLAIVGTSGSGKSSLVRAGLLPGLYGGLMAGSSKWRVVDLRPGTDPIGHLAAALDAPGALHEAGVAPAESFTDATLRRSGLGLVQAVREARLPAAERVLVLVDQFEELFRALEGDSGARLGDDATAFVKLLLEAAQQEALPIYVVLTMRSDFLGECAGFSGLPEAISDGQYLIPRLTRDQQREAITGPAAVHGVSLTPTLVNRLLNDVGGNPDQLPILQHALMRSWDLWARNPARGVAIDLADYERIGGMGEALSRHADAVLDELAGGDSAHGLRRVAEHLFKALAAIGASGRAVRRFAKVQDVADIAAVPVAEVMAVVEAFRAPRNSFLMPPVDEPLGPETTIDISHESLIRNWAQLRRWLAEEAESARIYERLATTAALRAQGQAGLWGHPDLGVALTWRDRQQPTAAWARRYTGHFVQAMDFLDDSLAQTLAAEQRLQRRRRVAAAGVVFSLLTMLALTVNWVAQEAWRRIDLESNVQQTLAQLKFVNDELAPRYRRHLETGLIDAEGCRSGAEPMAGSGLEGIVERVCDAALPDAELADFFKISRLLAAGQIAAAGRLVDSAAQGIGMPAWSLLESIVGLQSPRLRAERRELVKLQPAQWRAGGAGPPLRPPALDRFAHPVHRTLAGKLLARPAQALTPDEAFLLAAYARIDGDRAYRRRAAEWGDVALEVASVNGDEPPQAPADDGYMRMVQGAAQHESAGLEKLVDTATAYAWSFLVLLAWPLWRLWRFWQRRRGRPVAPRPGALRRALAAVFDSGMAVGVFMAVNLTFFAALSMGLPFEWADPLSLLLGALAALAWLLLGDAVHFRHRRSLGKIAFDLRPVRDGPGPAGAVGATLSARRNAVVALWLVVVLAGTLASWDEGFEPLLELLGGVFVFGLLAIFWLAMALVPGGRTVGDRWSGTHVIDADSDESLRIDAPPRYVHGGGAAAAAPAG